MKYLAVCSSTIQIMFVLNLKNTKLKKDSVEIVFTDTLNGYKSLAENSTKYQIFDSSYTADSFKLSRRIGRFEKTGSINNLIFMLKRKKYINDILNLENKYDVLMFNNLDDFTCGLYDVMYHQNPKLKLFLFEDGYSTYCIQGKTIIANYKKNSKLTRRIFNKFLRIKVAVLNINGQFLYNEKEIEWPAYFRRIQIEKFNPNDKSLLKKLNLLFGIKNLVDSYEQPIIFFEESYRTENIKINDIDIVNDIASWVGKEKIIVKVHPRNIDNVYKKLGYKTNIDTGIPWEILYLNKPEMSKKLLISVASGSIATPFTMLGYEPHSVSLINMKKVNPCGWVSDYYDYLNRKIFTVRPDLFSCPTDEIQLKKIVIEFLDSYE